VVAPSLLPSVHLSKAVAIITAAATPAKAAASEATKTAEALKERVVGSGGKDGIT
jgi:hypothetical protein